MVVIRTAAPTPSLAQARAVAASVCDPEVPVLTIDDLGVLQVARAFELIRAPQRPWPQPPGR